MKAGWLLVGVALAIPAGAHDLITAESAQDYLARQERLSQVLSSSGPASGRAEAALELGRLLDEIHELLNRDLEAHGKVQGLASNFLMAELRARGTPLEWSAPDGRFAANLKYYREALRLGGEPAVNGEASFRLLQGWFYDSFAADPLQPEPQAVGALADQIRSAEDFLKRYPRHAGREEATFILAIQCMQAAGAAASPQQQAALSRKARAVSADFLKTYPDSLRGATLSALLERLPAG